MAEYWKCLTPAILDSLLHPVYLTTGVRMSGVYQATLSLTRLKAYLMYPITYDCIAFKKLDPVISQNILNRTKKDKS